MNGAHAHLMVNHVSLFAFLIGVVALLLSRRRKSADLRQLASGLFIVAGVFAVLGFESGEKAEDVLKAMGDAAWADFKPFVHQHEDAAEWARRSAILVSGLAVAMEWAARKKKAWLNRIQWAVILFAIHGCTVFAATSYFGGKVRHTEVRE